MRVSELIKQLQELPQDAPVFIMGAKVAVADRCYVASEGIFDIKDWEGGGICCDLEDGDVFVEISG